MLPLTTSSNRMADAPLGLRWSRTGRKRGAVGARGRTATGKTVAVRQQLAAKLRHFRRSLQYHDAVRHLRTTPVKVALGSLTPWGVSRSSPCPWQGWTDSSHDQESRR